MFKTECTRFLDNVTALRSSAVNKAVAEAIQNEHNPHERDLIAARDAVIVAKRTKVAEQIKVLQANLDKEVNSITVETSKAIADHKERVVSRATAKAQANYDSFILGVSKLVDATNL